MKPGQKRRPLDVENRWECLTWKAGGEQIESPQEKIDRVLIDDKTYEAVWRRIGTEYDDMDHRYTSYSWHLFVVEPTFGTEVAVAPMIRGPKGKRKVYVYL